MAHTTGSMIKSSHVVAPAPVLHRVRAHARPVKLRPSWVLSDSRERRCAESWQLRRRHAVSCKSNFASDAETSAETEAQQDFRDELGELAEQIGVLAKDVDDALNGTSIFLVGMMGSGKSTVGKMLANVLQYCFFDTDAVIEQAAQGMTVSQIFEDSGEEVFRDIESNVLRELSAYKNCVIATGGGAVIRSTNWGSMQAGVTVYLEGSVEELERRIAAQDGGASRPLLADATESPSSMHEKLSKLLNERRKQYEAADCTVSIEGDGEAGGSPVRIVYDVLTAIDKKIKDSAAERAEFRKVTIKNEGTIPIGTPQNQEMKNEE